MDNKTIKSELRKAYISKRDAMPASMRKQVDAEISAMLLDSKYYKEAKTIFAYISIGNEVDTSEIIQKALDDGKIVCVPRMGKKRHMDTIPIKDRSELVRENWGIPEPSLDAESIEPDKIDLIIVPCMSFDSNGSRLGYGGGFYDVFLGKVNPDSYSIAIQRSEFMHEGSLPTEEFDVSVDCVLTEKGWLYF